MDAGRQDGFNQLTTLFGLPAWVLWLGALSAVVTALVLAYFFDRNN